jgi:signal transduction histidine kinase
MLAEFLATNHDELVKRCKAKVAERQVPPAGTEPEFGIPLLLGQLVTELRLEQSAQPGTPPGKLPANIGSTAGKHGNELLRKGFTIDQVVHDYGDLCQAVTELAHEREAAITVDEFHTFNRCLDNAIADAVTEFGRQRDQTTSEERAASLNERLGNLAHELRNRLSSGMLAYQAVKNSNMTLAGATGDVLGRSLIGLRDVIDRSLADVRLTVGLQVHREPFSVRGLLDEINVSAAMEVKTKGLLLTIAPVDDALLVAADRQMIFSAIANLLQNAFKFTKHGGHVSLTAHSAAQRLIIDIEDECGGLPPGRSEELFQPFAQRSVDRTGLGLGLSISRRAVQANGGTLRVRNLPGKGCVFTIDLPLRSM